MQLLGGVIGALALSQLTAASPAPPGGPWGYHHHPSDPGHNKLGAVSSESSICSNIGTDVLQDGGNAADALVATVFCVGVIGMVRSTAKPGSTAC